MSHADINWAWVQGWLAASTAIPHDPDGNDFTTALESFITSLGPEGHVYEPDNMVCPRCAIERRRLEHASSDGT